MKATKVAFTRRNGLLYDDDACEILPNDVVGDRLDDTARRTLRERIRTDREVVLRELGVHLRPATSQPTTPDLPGLLLRLRSGVALVWEDVVEVGRRLDDADFRQAAVKGMGVVPLDHLSTYARWIGAIATPESRDALETRVNGIVAATDGRAPAYSAEEAIHLSSTIEVLLRLSPFCVCAAEALERLVRDPRASVRVVAVRSSVALLRARSPLVASFASIAQRLLNSDADPYVTMHIIAAGIGQREVVVERIHEMLRDPSPEVRRAAAGTAIGLGAPWSIALILMWLPQETSLRHALSIATSVAPLLEEQFLIDLTTRGLAHSSPTTRLTAASALAEIRAEESKRVSRAALADEPDAGLRFVLELYGETR